MSETSSWKLAAAMDLIPELQIKLEFDPIDVSDRAFVIHFLPSSPLLLFQLFISIFLVKKWVKYTN